MTANTLISTLGGMQNAIKIKDTTEDNWTVVQILGRGERELVGSLSEEQALERFGEFCKQSLPGTIAIKDPKGHVAMQQVGFVDDKTRRGRDKDGKPYEPEVVEVGAPAPNLSPFAEWIKSLPDTEPAEGEEIPSYAEWKAKAKPQAEPRAEPEPQPAESRPKESTPTSDLYSFGSEIAKTIWHFREEKLRLRRKRFGFAIRLALFLVLGDPPCRETVQKAFDETP